MERRLKITVSMADDGCEIGRVLLKEGFTRHQIRSLKFREQGILQNGVRARVTKVVSAGDVLELLLDPGDAEKSGGGDEHNLKVVPKLLYEDSDLLVLDKPEGIAVHPGRGHYDDSLASLLGRWYPECGSMRAVRIVGRLDLETSGVLLVARHQMAAARLSRQRTLGQLQKTYLAVVQGVPEPSAGIIDRPIGPSGQLKNRMVTDENGRRAVTHYQVLEEIDGNALVKFRLETGRTHQIRVHMASTGHPLLYDSFYGTAREGRMTALHAWKLEFYQPFSGKFIQVTSPVTRREFNKISVD